MDLVVVQMINHIKDVLSRICDTIMEVLDSLVSSDLRDETRENKPG